MGRGCRGLVVPTRRVKPIPRPHRGEISFRPPPPRGRGVTTVTRVLRKSPSRGRTKTLLWRASCRRATRTRRPVATEPRRTEWTRPAGVPADGRRRRRNCGTHRAARRVQHGDAWCAAGLRRRTQQNLRRALTSRLHVSCCAMWRRPFLMHRSTPRQCSIHTRSTQSLQ